MLVDWDAAQITLEGRPPGPGAGASLSPVPGVELVFDRAGGRLSQVVVEAGEPFGPVVPGEPALAYLGRVLGGRVAAAVRQAPYGTVPPVMPRPHRPRSPPCPGSPGWIRPAYHPRAVVPPVGDGGRQLARKAGWAERTGACHGAPAFAIAGPGRPAAVAARASTSPSGWLDPAVVPPAAFRYGLSPDSDLDIRVHDDGSLVSVEAVIAPGRAGRAGLVPSPPGRLRCPARPGGFPALP